MSKSREKTIAIDQQGVAGGSPLEVTELTPYLWGLMAFITVCTLFEYYDALILNLALPYLGRRHTAYLYYGLGGISSMVCFLTREPLFIAACYNLSVWAMGGIIPLCLTITSELFPTEVRASANAVANNLLGRFGMVFSPWLVGILSAGLGSVGGAISLISLAPLLCILLVLFLVPETRGRVLEEIPSLEVGREAEIRR